MGTVQKHVGHQGSAKGLTGNKAQPKGGFKLPASPRSNGHTHEGSGKQMAGSVEVHAMVPMHLKGGKTLETHIRECGGMPKHAK